MKLTLDNIGMISHADIRLDGLTVIAGENDTGKSTVGKLIFALIKAFNRYEQDLHESKAARAFALIERAYFSLRRTYDLRANEAIREGFFPPQFSRDLQKSENPLVFLDDKIVLLRQFGADAPIKHIESVKKLYAEEEEKERTIQRALTKALVSEFYFELSPKNTELTSTIRVSEGANQIIDISIKSNKIEALTLYDDLYFNDVTLIETPIFLQMYDLIRSASTLFEMQNSSDDSLISGRQNPQNPIVAVHAKDLISKLENAQYYLIGQQSLFAGNFDELLADILETTHGVGFSFEKKSKDFYFNKNETTSFKSINTATGLKAFGIIQLLLQANVLNERSLLIIDEPEIHLHPKWQVEYARLIVALVKNDIPVLLTSHSPEIIQALSTFSEQYGIKECTAFYLTEREDAMSTITDVSHDLNKIFIKLTEPLHNLVWS